MKLLLTYADKETHTIFRNECIELPNIHEAFLMDNCEKLANEHCEKNEDVMDWRIIRK